MGIHASELEVDCVVPSRRANTSQFAALAVRAALWGHGRTESWVSKPDHQSTNGRVNVMADEKSGPKAAVSSVAEGVKGRMKEAAGAVSGDEKLKREGEAQQEKAGAEREVAKKEAEAEKARAQARAHEAEQKAKQG
jgi:uncharacterized protein YjbJ (UPF0337 family)